MGVVDRTHILPAVAGQAVHLGREGKRRGGPDTPGVVINLGKLELDDHVGPLALLRPLDTRSLRLRLSYCVFTAAAEPGGPGKKEDEGQGNAHLGAHPDA